MNTDKHRFINYIIIILCAFIIIGNPAASADEPDDNTDKITFEIEEEQLEPDVTGLLEVVYKWQEPQTSVDEIVYKRLIKVQGERLGCYYYSMYARCKDEIIISHRQSGKPPTASLQKWAPEKVLLAGKKITIASYNGIVERGELKNYRIYYYQQTPFGILKLGIIRSGTEEFIPDLRFVRCIASEVGKETPPTLWHIGALFTGSLALFDYFNPKEEKKNHTPIADFLTIPVTGTLNTDFYLDASVSADRDEPSSSLLVRWDINNDGNWDNIFSASSKITSTRFASLGSHTIKLQVRDRQGASAIITKTVTTIAVGPGLGSTPHPMFRNTITHTGVSNYNGPLITTTKWSTLTGEQIEASPSIASDGTIYIGSYDSNLYALNPATGGVLWTSPLAGVVHSSAAIGADGRIYVGAGNNLYALNPSNGVPYWLYNTGDLVRSSPVIDADGTIYIGSLNGNLYAINHNGSFKWSFTTGGQIWSSPAIGQDGTIYVGSMDNKLYAINPNSTIKWSYTTGGAIYSSPVIASDGTVYVGSFDGSFYAVNSNGSLKWKFSTGGQIWSSGALRNNRIHFGSDDGKLYCRNASDGTSQWSFTAGNKIRSSPTIDAIGSIYFGADDGKLHCLDSSGASLTNWPLDISGPITPIRSSIAIANAILYVGSYDKKIYAIGAVALDPAELSVQKYANKTQVSIGDVVTYKIVITNRGVDPTTSTATTVIDNIPAGFKYIKGSTVLSGVSQPDPSGNDVLIFDVGHFTPGSSRILAYQLVVGSGVSPGRYVNKAYAKYYYNKPPLTEGVTNLAKQEVWVIPDPLFDLGTIIGKVFWDKNANGIQDKDEGGYGVATIIMEDGTIITTDKNGNYHIPGVKPGSHILHLKDVPAHFITTDMLVRVTPGLLVKANLGIKPVDQPAGSPANRGKESPLSPLPFLKGLSLVALGEGIIGGVSTNDRKADKQDKSLKNGHYADGRFAYYLTGKIQDKFTIDSSLDTERRTQDAQHTTLSRYIDPDKYYPEYGDGSTINYDSTNTQGPFYLKIESLPEAKLGKSSLLWGTYNSGINQTELTTYNRTLSGAKLDVSQLPLYKNERLKLSTSGTFFVSQNSQIPAHNEFRSTGGSIYYLKHKDIISGSEQIRVETRDKITNLVLSTRRLSRDDDYEMDYSNGRIILKQPLNLVDTSESITSNNILNGNPIYVIVDYEFSSNIFDFKEETYGGRLSGTIQDNMDNKMQLGGTLINEKDERNGAEAPWRPYGAHYELKGIDFSLTESVKFIRPLRLSLSAEYAKSISQGVDGYISTDGGFTQPLLAGAGSSANSSDKGRGWKVKGGLKPSDWLSFDTYYQKLEPGFTSSTSYSYEGSSRYGYAMAASLSQSPKKIPLTINIRYDTQELLRTANIVSRSNIGADKTETGSIQGIYQQDKWTITNEYRYQESSNRVANVNSETNKDLTLGALKIDYAIKERSNLYLIQQATLKGDPNSQTTLGSSLTLNKKIALSLQGTTGNKGESFLLGVNNRISDKTETFSNVSINNSPSEHSLQTSNGASHQVTPVTRVYAQQDYGVSNTQSSTDSTIGQETNLANKWRLSATIQQGVINNYNVTETTRQSASIGIRYDDKDKTLIATKLEARLDDGPVDRHQYLYTNMLRHQITEDITVSVRDNYSIAENETINKREALFNEMGFGIALRPVKWDCWHLIAKFTYLKDIYPLSQSDAQNITPSKTLSNIYAIETAYDLSAKLQLVEKYALKIAEEKVAGHSETDNRTELGISRVNYNVLQKWYAAVEYRIRIQTLGNDIKSGFLLEATYKVDKNIHLGVGYNFTNFDDDLRKNNSYQASGFFIRINTIFAY